MKITHKRSFMVVIKGDRFIRDLFAIMKLKRIDKQLKWLSNHNYIGGE